MVAGSARLLAELARAIADGGAAREPNDATVSAHFWSVLGVAKKMRRIFHLPVPDAPGLAFVGGEVDPAAFGLGSDGDDAVSVAGSGTDLIEATVSCVCEAVEFLSQLVGCNEELMRANPSAIDTGLDPRDLAQLLSMMGFDPTHPAPDIRWIEATRLSDGANILLPAGLCLRGVEEPGARDSGLKLSTGCGAGPTRQAALLHGLLELVERDAVAMWWLGGRGGRKLPSAVANEALDYIDKLRQQTTGRSSWLIDLTTDIAIPCVAALSVDPEGRGFACGFSARLSYAVAAKAAVREMCQMELGLHLIDLKQRQRGKVSLNKVDRMYLRRANGFDVQGCELLHPAGDGELAVGPGQSSAEDPIGMVSKRLASHGIDASWADLTRPALAIPSVRALAAGLQPYPSNIVTARLERQIRQTGGGFGLTNELQLM